MAAISDEGFADLAERHRRELRVHCYRMLGSYDEAEDLVQETYLRAWRRRETFAGLSTFRAWLYRIATNACLDALDKRPPQRRVAATDAGAAPPPAAVTWLQPYPDRQLDAVAPADAEPDTVVVARETVALAFLVAIQHLSPRQRAVVILRDVLGWPARETAETLGTTVAAVNSTLQRARPVLRQHLPGRRLDWAAGEPAGDERALLDRYMRALSNADDAALARLLREDVRVSQAPGAGGNMSDEPGWYSGRDTVVAAWAPALHGEHALDWRFVVTAANRQPALGVYVRPRGTAGDFQAFGLTVLRVEAGQVAEVTVFGNGVFPAFALPPALPAATPARS